MKCVAIKEKRKFEVKDIKAPENDIDRVVIDVKKVGICGSDLHYFENGEPAGLVMGHEFIGTVKSRGCRKDLHIGDRVTALPISPCGKCKPCQTGNPQYCAHTWDEACGLNLKYTGAYAEKMSIRADMVLKVSNKISDNEAAMIEPTAVGLHAVHLANVRVGQRVLVIGGGIIGLVSAMFAKMEGACFVAVSETNKKRGEKAVRLGVADTYLDATDPNFLANVSEVTNGKGFDTVIECCGNSKAVTSAMLAANPGGTIILVGVSTAPIEIPSIIGVMKEQTIKGAIAYTKEEFITVMELIEDKQINVTKFIDKIVSLDKVQEAFEELTCGNSGSIKILIDPTKK